MFTFRDPGHHFDESQILLAQLDPAASRPRRRSTRSTAASPSRSKSALTGSRTTLWRSPTRMSTRAVISGRNSASVGSSSTVTSNRLVSTIRSRVVRASTPDSHDPAPPTGAPETLPAAPSPTVPGSRGGPTAPGRRHRPACGPPRRPARSPGWASPGRRAVPSAAVTMP